MRKGKILKITGGVWFSVLLAGIVAAFLEPVGFQKANTVVEGKAPAWDPEAGPYCDIRSLVEPIPYKKPLVFVNTVHPAARYRRTIQEGYGHCSDLVWGAAHQFERRGQPYRVIHFLYDKDKQTRSFMEGEGHTIFQLPYRTGDETGVGILDMLEGGLIKAEGQDIGPEDLVRGGLKDISVQSFNPAQDMKTPYYGEFLDLSTIGIVTREDVRQYFDFIDLVYVPFGHETLERYLYDGMALVFGYYPPIYVEDTAKLYEGRELQRLFYKLTLWMVRITLVLIPLSLGWMLWKVFRKKRTSSTS